MELVERGNAVQPSFCSAWSWVGVLHMPICNNYCMNCGNLCQFDSCGIEAGEKHQLVKVILKQLQRNMRAPILTHPSPSPGDHLQCISHISHLLACGCFSSCFIWAPAAQTLRHDARISRRDLGQDDPQSGHPAIRTDLDRAITRSLR